MTKTTAPKAPELAEGGGAVTAASWTIVVMGVVTALYLGQDLLIPIALALLLAFVLTPLVSWLRRRRTPRGAAVAVAVSMAFAVIFGLGAIIAGQIGQLAGDLPKYQSTMSEKIHSLKGWTGGYGTLERAADMLQTLAEELNAPTGAVTTQAGEDPNKRAPNAPQLVEVFQSPPTQLQNLRDIATPLLHPMATTGIIVVFVIFILLQREDLRNRMMSLAGSRDIQRTTAAVDEAAGRLAKLLLTQLALNSGFGLVIGIGLWAIGVPSPALWGILAGVLRFVPYIGAVISAVFPLLLAAAVDPGWTKLIATGALFAAVEPIVGHIIEPMVYGRSAGLSPVAIVVSATFWTALWGPIGLVLATPLTVCMVVLGRHVEGLKFLDVMFGDRPALTPPEIFYQRMLARDPGEAAEKAQEFLREKSLSAYYEEVAIPGLLLAQRDAERGALEGERLERVRDSVAELVEDLDAWDDIEPNELLPTMDPEAADAIESVEDDATAADLADADEPPPARVRCVAARTPVEAAAALIVAQVLKKHGFKPQVEDEEFLLTSGVVEMEQAGPTLVCAIFLDAEESHLRLVTRRIRKRLPTARIIVGAWESSDREPQIETVTTAAKSDRSAISLRGVVAACLEETRARDTATVAQRNGRGPAAVSA